MNNQENTDNIDLKSIIKKATNVGTSKKKTFSILFVVIMVMASLFFIKEMISPMYLTEVLLKSRYVKKDQLQNTIEAYNVAITNKNYTTLPLNVSNTILKYKINKFDIKEIKPELNSPDKNDGIKMYRLYTTFKSKPENLEEMNVIIHNIQKITSEDNETVIAKSITSSSINEIDTLLSVATEAGNAFKNKMNTAAGSMMVMNDLYKSLNEILQRKADLQLKLASLQSNNLIYTSSSWILKKSINMPIISFLVGFIIWLLVCVTWIGLIIVFKDEE